WECCPCRQANGNLCWGETRHTSSIFFYGTRGCFETSALGGGMKASGLLVVRPEQFNKPDSLRLYLNRISRCYSFTALTAATCSPTTGHNARQDVAHLYMSSVDGT